MEPRPGCPLLGNNKEGDDQAPQGSVNVYMLDANKAIIKLRTSSWALHFSCTLFFRGNFREGWTFIHFIRIMELILPSASDVS